MIWIDAHLSPAISTWITSTLGISALALRDVGLRDAEDTEIFEAAKSQGIIFMTKDSDFVDLVNRFGHPSPNYFIDMWKQHIKRSIKTNLAIQSFGSPRASSFR